MTNSQKKNEQILTTWTELKAKIISKLAGHHSDLRIILSELIAIDKKQSFTLATDEEFSLSDIMVGINRIKERIASLEQENWQLKGLDGDSGSGEGGSSTIEEVD